jgi:beta-barrel assembly-enhancing protease
MKVTFFFRQFVMLALVFSACTHPVKISLPSPEEIVKKETHMGQQLASRVKSQLVFKQDAKVSQYLRQMAETLTKSIPEFKNHKIHLFMVQFKQSPEGKIPLSVSLPKDYIYLSIPILRLADYDSEIAAEIAVQYGHLLKRHVYGQLLKYSGLPLKEIPLFGRKGVLTFSKEEQLEALLEGVEILYRAGFDPRGIVSMMAKFENLESGSPYSLDDIAEFLDKIREKIALYVPLRNPIVRTQRFLSIQERIRNL